MIGLELRKVCAHDGALLMSDEKQIAFEDVETAMYLAIARRLIRRKDAPKLGPIRSLHYFLPVIDEVKNVPISGNYREYLRRKIVTLPNTG